MQWMKITGKLTQGYRVASGPSKDYPYGTIEKQKPVFKKLGLNLDNMFNGTLNVSIGPKSFEMFKPEFMLEKVEWTDLHPPETFSFSRCRIVFKGSSYEGWVYYPHPETKEKHQQSVSTMEILAQKIPDIQYDDELILELNNIEISIHNSAN